MTRYFLPAMATAIIASVLAYAVYFAASAIDMMWLF